MHKARTFFYVCAGLFLLAGAYALGAVTATSRAEKGALESGRFQVVIGGPKEFGGAILLDSATGQTFAWAAMVNPEASDVDRSYWREYGPKGSNAARGAQP